MLQQQQLQRPGRPPFLQAPRGRDRAACLRRVSRLVRAQSRASTAKEQASAKASVEAGLQLFSNGKYRDALVSFESALQANPTDDEARAALYNSACAHAKLKQWQPATDAVKRAVNDYRLRLTVAIKVNAEYMGFRAVQVPSV